MTPLRTCVTCGFENAEDGKSCPLCGSSSTQVPERQTLHLSDATRTAETRAESRSPEPDALAIGSTIGERFRVESLLGRGGMGQVFRVRDLESDTPRALKVLPAANDRERAERFRREIGVLSKMDHAAVPRIHAWGATDTALWFVSDLIEGENLKLAIERRGPWPAVEVVAVGCTLADALTAAHARGIVHRDVKPANVMLDPAGGIHLLDFGLARGAGVDLASLTRTGMVVGTPAYMSPEQFEGLDVDDRTDIYSLGIVLFELLTARLPFTASSPIALGMKHKLEVPPAPRSMVASVPAWLERVVLRCMAKDPAARFESSAALLAELRHPRTGAARTRSLPTGDRLREDPAQTTDWALVLEAPGEKTGWTSGMALLFEERHYRLLEIEPPAGRAGAWTYRFGEWPEGLVFRRLVDYTQDCAVRQQQAAEATLSSRLNRWLGRKPE